MRRMMKSFALVLAIVTLPLVAFGQSDASGPLPFPVKIGGQAAQTKAGAAFAAIEKAVPSDAAIELGTKGADMSIINVVTADEKGTPKQGATPAVLIIQSGTKTTLDKTMDNQKLAPGNYLMSVVAEGKTASILLKVQ
jgi:hypothetical protein